MLDFLNGTMTMEGFIVLVAFVLVAVAKYEIEVEDA